MTTFLAYPMKGNTMKTRQLAFCIFLAILAGPVAASQTQKPGMSKKELERMERMFGITPATKRADEAVRRQVAARFNEEQRKRIYAELTRAEARATHEAAQTYEPPFRDSAESNAFMALEDRLTDRFRRQIEKQHRLTPVQRKAIEREGTQKDWPAPGIMKQRR